MGGGLFPLDEQLQVRGKGCSEALAKLMVWLYGLVQDDLAERILCQVGGLSVSDTSIWRRGQEWGEKIKDVEATRISTAMVVQEYGGVVRGESENSQRMGVAMDGTMLNVREEGWKELKVGCVFEVELEGQGQEEQVHALKNSYVAVLGGPKRLGRALWAEASRRRLPGAAESIVLGDGAPWIWNVTAEHFPYSRQAVDWYHAKEHLYRAAHLALGEGSAQAIRWAKAMETPLYQGHTWRLVAEIERLAKQHRPVAQELRKEAKYFQRNKRRMQYLELREDGFPIGSGMVESGCKQFRARFNGPGMRWSRPGAERLIPIRAAILSNRFSDLWAAARNSPPD